MEQLFRLRRFLEAPEPARRKGQACELCGAAIDNVHAHVIDLKNRRLLCTCRPCYLLFKHSGAAGGKFRSVPDRFLELPDLSISLEGLQIPVGIAFFLWNSARNRVTAFYPSPAGATESGLPLETWQEMVKENPALGAMEPDIEALLICRRRDNFDAWIVPVDACYELAGRIRTHWKGFEGGEAWREIDAFLAGLRERERNCA